MVLFDTSSTDQAFAERWAAAEPIARSVARRHLSRACDQDDAAQHMLERFPVADRLYPGEPVSYIGFLRTKFKYFLFNWLTIESRRGVRGVPEGESIGWTFTDSSEPPDEIDRAYVGIRDCVQCGREFAPTADHVLLCSRQCHTAIHQRRATIATMAGEMVAVLDRLRESMATIQQLRATCERPLGRIVQLRDFGFVISEVRGLFSLIYCPIADGELPARIAVSSIDALPVRNCPYCDTRFDPATVGQVFCSESCGTGYQLRDKRWQRQNELAEILLAMLKGGPQSTQRIATALRGTYPVVLIDALREMGHSITAVGTRKQGFVYTLRG